LLLIEAQTGRTIASTDAHRGSVFGLAFVPPDGKTLVTAGHDQLIHFWTVPALEKVNTLHGHRDEIWALSFSADGRLMCTAGKDGTAKIWSPSYKPPPVCLTNLSEAEFSADSRHLVALTRQGPELALDLWEVSNPGVRITKTLPLTDPSNIVKSKLSPGAKFLGLERTGGAVEVWNLETGKLLRSRMLTNAQLTATAFSPGGRLMAFGTSSGTVDLLNLQTGQITPYGAAGNAPVGMVSFSPGSHFLTAAREDQTHTMIWDLRSGAELSLPPGTSERFAFSPDGRTLAAGDASHAIHLIDLPDRTERSVLKGHRWTIYSLAFSPDSRVLATGGGDAVARLWDVATGQELTRPLRGHLQGITELAFSPDGKALATGSTDHSVKVWHVATGRELFSVPEAEMPVFSPDGNTLVMSTRPGLRLFHVPTLPEIDAARRDLADRDHR
jgi:WD40 repeat protein